MQIIAGKFRGKRLEWVSNATTRPTTNRVKENIFNVLSSMGADFNRVLVLFAGSGQMGLECYSRGATEILFNDTSPEARKVIQKNCASLNIPPFPLNDLDYMKCLEKYKDRVFDIVFLDPPFADLSAAPNAARYLRENGMLAKNAVIVAETESDDMQFPGFDVRVKTYGRARIYFLKLCK